MRNLSLVHVYINKTLKTQLHCLNAFSHLDAESSRSKGEGLHAHQLEGIIEITTKEIHS